MNPSISLCVFLLLALLPLLRADQSGAFTFTSSGTAVTITAYTGLGGAVDIPGAINGLPVIAIGANAFRNKSSLLRVTIPPGVTSIGDSAFYGCYELTSVSIPAGVTSIGSSAFNICNKLGIVSIPASVVSIGSYAFDNCVTMSAISVDPANPTFSSQDGTLCNRAQTVLLQCPAGKTGAYAIPEGITSIGPSAFAHCTRLTSVSIPDSVTGVGDSSFAHCTGLTRVSVLAGVTSIGSSAFVRCTSLTSVNIPAGVTSIGAYAFSDCTGLLLATFSGHAPTMGPEVFGNCAPGFTVRYYDGNTGFATPPWQGHSTLMLAAAREIEVSGPGGSALADGAGTVGFGTVSQGWSAARVFTIANTGSVALANLAVGVDGANAEDFTVGELGATTLAAGAGTSLIVTFAPGALGVRHAAIHIASNDGDETPFDIALTGTGFISLAESVEQPASGISNSGTMPWAGQAATTHDGRDAAQSGAIMHSQSSGFSLFAIGPGTVTFWWKVSSESNSDYLRFYLDGMEQSGKISGTVEWRQESISLVAGPHMLRWEYSKNSDVSAGGDCGWVDQVVLPNSPTPIQSWRQTNFGTTDNTGNAADTADPDCDGHHNLDEFAALTNPHHPVDFFRVLGTAKTGSTLTLTVAGKAGRSYLMERSTNPAETWTQVVQSAILTADTAVTLTDPAAPARNTFYRIRVTVF